MRKIKASLLLLTLAAAPVSTVAPALSVRDAYDYRETVSGIVPENRPTYAVSASASPVENRVSGYETEGSIETGDAVASLVLAVPRGYEVENEEDLRVVFRAGDRTEVRFADVEDGGSEINLDGRTFTSPAVFPKSGTVSYRIVSKSPLPKGTEILSVDVSSKSLRFEIAATKSVRAAAGGLSVVSRADWGADESMRYRDSSVWKAYFEKLAKEGEGEITAETKAYREKMARIEAHIANAFPGQYEPVETIAQENGHELVWPIEKTRRVEKVVLHHTAENNLKDLDDASLLRSTYRYHAVTRGWGDIGYNYVVGQRGTVYEGRAGGDYVIGAHASWNNRSTVGVSVIGNFEVDNLNADQEAGVRTALQALSKKYGIDYSKTSYSHRECKSSASCDVEDYETPNLVGHREVGYTSCPGKNFYALFPGLKKEATYSLGLKPVENPKYAVYLASKSAAVSSSNLPKGPSVRILLSYPASDSVTVEGYASAPKFGNSAVSGILRKNMPLKIEAAAGGNLSLVLSEKKIGTLVKKKTVKLGKTAFFESDVLRVKSWDRKPSWDKSGTMNDNLFRGKIEIRNENGKIVLINELPLENYLKGLAEISNGDHPEKIKTILVAARSYAYFYSKQENRKFPGKPYDGSDDPDVFQKYLGYGYELRSPTVGKYVDETNGETIAHSGSVIKPWYFSESDGRVRSYKEYCQARVDAGTLPKSTVCQDVPYLQGAVDPGGV